MSITIKESRQLGTCDSKLEFMRSVAKSVRKFIAKRGYARIVKGHTEALISWLPNLKRKSEAILIVRLDAIGDFIIWLDAAKELRSIYPGQRITLIANDSWAQFAQLFPFWDEVLPINRQRFLYDFGYRLKLLLRIRKGSFAVAIQPTFSREFKFGDSIIRATGAKKRIGSEGDLSNISAAEKQLADKWYTDLVPAKQIPLMELERNAEFIWGLGHNKYHPRVYYIEPLPNTVPFYGMKKPYLVVFPGASWQGKIWPWERFAKLIIKMKSEFRYNIVLCGGIGDFALCEKITNSADLAVSNLAGKTQLNDLVEIIRGAELVISNDTSAIHIAAATSTKSVCILGGGHFGRFLPYSIAGIKPANSPETVHSGLDCFNCNWQCKFKRAESEAVRCIAEITVDMVFEACRAQLTGVINLNNQHS